MLSTEQQHIQARADAARAEIARLQGEQAKLDAKLAGLAEQRQQYELLDQVCESLEKLDRLGAAHLFWGEEKQSARVGEQVTRARTTATAFVQKIRDIEQEKASLGERIREEEVTLINLAHNLADLQAEEEALANELVVTRELPPLPYRPMVMPWHGQVEDDRRFRKSVGLALLAVMLLAIVTKLWVFPARQEQEVVAIPKQLVRLVQAEKPKPQPVEQARKKETEKSKDVAKGSTPEKQKAHAKAMKSGVLAFKEGFSDLIQDSNSLKLGTDANIKTSGALAAGPGNGARSLVLAQAQAGGSGGIASASLGRSIGGTGTKLGGVGFSRVDSGVGAAAAASADRPLSGGAGPSRTDEEIQIVFDRYKATLYRIYNRELRSDPSLRGKMILRLTIDPNGEVSACRIESTDLASPALGVEIVERVKKFNFGAKDGVPKITILYPIDFLPASG